MYFGDAFTADFRLVRIESICMRQNKSDLKNSILFRKGKNHNSIATFGDK